MSKGFFQRYEFRRKFVHLGIGLFLVFIINLNVDFISHNLIIILFFALVIAALLSVYIRKNRPEFAIRFLQYFDKPEDLKDFPARGAVFYLIGVLLALIFFERRVASAATLILAIGDPAAHIVGRYFGKNKIIINPKKLLEGTLAATFLTTFAAWIFVPLPIAFFGAAFGMMAEAVELKMLRLDDNFFIPFVSGIVMEMLLMML